MVYHTDYAVNLGNRDTELVMDLHNRRDSSKLSGRFGRQ